VPVQRIREDGKLGDRTADRATGSGRVLHAEPERVRRQLEELAQSRLDELHGVVEPYSEVRADVEDDGLGADRVSGLHRRAQRRQRVLADSQVAAREVHEVQRVARDRLDASLATTLPEALDLVLAVLRRTPHAWALGEDLD